MSELHELSSQASAIGSSVSASAEEMYQLVEELKGGLSHFKTAD
jgi:methyl-accepting chemotaxis protein